MAISIVFTPSQQLADTRYNVGHVLAVNNALARPLRGFRFNLERWHDQQMVQPDMQTCIHEPSSKGTVLQPNLSGDILDMVAVGFKYPLCLEINLAFAPPSARHHPPD